MSQPKFLAALIAISIFAAMTPAAEPIPNRAELQFVRSIRPLLVEKCLACHGDKPDELAGGLDLRTRSASLKGGDSEQAAIAPGEPERSPLMLAVERKHDDWSAMPPKENDRLTQEQLRQLREWITGGAPWPDAERVAEIEQQYKSQWDAEQGIQVPTSGGLTPEWTTRRYDPRNLWAYQPLRRDLNQRFDGRSELAIDLLLDERIRELGINPAPRADRRTLIRRVTFDLIGLPPTPAEIDDFSRDNRPDRDAFQAVVERLLASPHYGEHWARHWLDVVRYADSSGFANDYERGPAWRYRDYVVRAFNDDKPYDQFVREQIAGDEIDPGDPEMLIAVGFLRMGPWELTGMEVAKVARQRFLDDVTDSVGQVFLAHMLQCARCHDHKFDPVPTRDYYSLLATFATTQLADRPAAFLPQENRDGWSDLKLLEQRETEYWSVLRELDQKSLDAAFEWFRERQLDATRFEQVVGDARNRPASDRARLIFETARSLLQKAKVPYEQIPPRHVGFTPTDFGRERIARKGLERLKWERDRFEPIAFSVYSGPTRSVSSVYNPIRLPKSLAEGEIEQTAILAGGDPFSPTIAVQPGVLSAVNIGVPVDVEAAHDQVTGRRRQLARWITLPEHPLTARVMVNRIWQWHFGQPLARNPNNFGATGQPPTHPELLEWLATQFIDQGWSIKAMHRMILSSDAYTRSSQHFEPDQLAAKDPLGTSCAVFRPRHLTAEEIRDSLLAASGELNRAIGGVPIRPEINAEVAMQPRQVMGTFAPAWVPSPKREQRHRRSIYILKIRGLRDPFGEVFNEPTPDLSCEARETSIIAPQAFALFNGQATADRALALADRLRKSEPSREAVIQQAFLRLYGRLPDAVELQDCLQHWTDMTARQQRATFPRIESPRQVTRAAVEENTGEPFSFVETLHGATDFIPDLKPWDVDAETRALSDVCLVLMNANGFVYVD